MFWLSVIANDDLEHFLELLYATDTWLDTKLTEDTYGRTLGGYLFSPTMMYRKRIHDWLISTSDLILYKRVKRYIYRYITEMYSIPEYSPINEIDMTLLYQVLSFRKHTMQLYELLFTSRLIMDPNIRLMKACLKLLPSRIDRETNTIVKFDSTSSKRYWNLVFPELLSTLLESTHHKKNKLIIDQIILCLDYGLQLDVPLSIVVDDKHLYTHTLPITNRLQFRRHKDEDDPQNALDIVHTLFVCINSIHQGRSWTKIGPLFNLILRYVTFMPKLNRNMHNKGLLKAKRYGDDVTKWFKAFNQVQDLLKNHSVNNSLIPPSHTKLLRTIVGHDFHGLLRLYRSRYPRNAFQGCMNLNALLVVAKNRIIINDGSFALIRYLYDLGADLFTKDEYHRPIFSLLLHRMNNSISTEISKGMMNDTDKYLIDAKCCIFDYLSTQKDNYFYYVISDLLQYLKYFL
jgi:hypothetical protein